jgi:hypothetical protein
MTLLFLSPEHHKRSFVTKKTHIYDKNKMS